jgi:hypothetical protein
MTDRPDGPETSPALPRRRRCPYVVAPLALIALIGIGVYVYLTVSAESELQAAIAETDRLDPRWRLEDVEADRAVVSEVENSATPAMAAKQLLKPSWDTVVALADALGVSLDDFRDEPADASRPATKAKTGKAK